MSEKGTFVRVIVKPNSKKKELIEEIGENEIIINLESIAQKGKANSELVKRISKFLGISTSQVSLVAGHKSREKIILITNLSVEEVEKKLSS